MPSKPWDSWIPGVLSKTQMFELVHEGHVTTIGEPSIDHSSIDLHLDDEAYELTAGSVKPFGNRYLHLLTRNNLAKPIGPNEDGEFVLAPKTTYVFRVIERLHDIADSKLFGRATAKSSVGRVDVLARLIVDGACVYEGFDNGNVSGDMFLEITPMTFPVSVKKGIALTQLRFFQDNPAVCEIGGDVLSEYVIKNTDHSAAKDSLSVSLDAVEFGGAEICAYSASANSGPYDPIPLWSHDNPPDPCRYWTAVSADAETGRLQIQEDSFYILRSVEKLCLPRGVAVYCRASDESIGEIRIHYAGFVHPFFGQNRKDGDVGTPLIFEVRGHDVNVSLGDKEILARLHFYRMSQDCDDDNTLGPTEYTNQNLKLSKFFADWPDNVSVDKTGKIVGK